LNIGGLLFCLSRWAATEFSFFLTVPTLIAAGVYDALKNRTPAISHSDDVARDAAAGSAHPLSCERDDETKNDRKFFRVRAAKCLR
jgi:hypothetical protein